MQKQNGTLAASPSADGMAQALEEYLAAVEAGTAPPREELLARHPELAEDPDACLAAFRFIGRAAERPRSVVAGIAEPHAPEQAPGQLGDFSLIREVGRGGMGVVYEAEQVSLCRRVALKVLPFAATMDPRQLQCCHSEARAAASLDHPNIVHVHAVGCERAVHCYGMQYIEGQTLAAVIADLRQAGGQPAPPPQEQPTAPYIAAQATSVPGTAPRAAASTERAPRDRAHFRRMAELGMQAAEALDHAHTLGIVHRRSGTCCTCPCGRPTRRRPDDDVRAAPPDRRVAAGARGPPEGPGGCRNRQAMHAPSSPSVAAHLAREIAQRGNQVTVEGSCQGRNAGVLFNVTFTACEVVKDR